MSAAPAVTCSPEERAQGWFPAAPSSPPPAGDLLAALRRPFPAAACEQKGTYWYIGVDHVLDRANEVLGFYWSFKTDSIAVALAQQPTRDEGMRDGFEAVVSGHLLVQ